MTCGMNYNFDTEMDLDWAADQLRRAQNANTSLPVTPIRRVTPALHPNAKSCPTDPSVSQDTTLGNALSALTVHSHNDEQCRRICESILTLLSDRARVALHAEFVRLKGIDLVLATVKRHRDETAQMALLILDKRSRTSARQISAAGGIDIVLLRCEQDKQNTRVLEAALKVLHGLTFDSEVKVLLLRRGVHLLAAALIEAKMEENCEESEVQAYQAVTTIATRLAARLADQQKGYGSASESRGGRSKV